MDSLFEQFEQPIFRFLLRMCGNQDLASDLAQETLARGWQKRHSVRNHAALRTWLFRIAVNLWNDHRSTVARIPLTEDWIDQPSSEPTPDQSVIDAELGRMLWLAIAELPLRQQQVMHLRAVEELSIEEIAAVLEIDRGLVRSNLCAARKNMRHRIATKVELNSLGNR